MFKQLAVTVTATLLLASTAAAASGAGDHRVDRRVHQHQGIGGPHHPHGPHRRVP